MKNILLITLTVCFCLKTKAQTTTAPLDTIALIKEMNSYYAQAKTLAKQIPNYDSRGLFGGTSLMAVNETQVFKTWYIAKTCDCSGKVIRIDSLESAYSSLYFKIVPTLNVEWRPIKTLSLSMTGFRMSHTLDSGKFVNSENNNRASLRERMTTTQLSLQSSVKWHFYDKFYVGGGINWAHFKVQNALTNTLVKNTASNSSEAPPQYEPVLIDENRIKNYRWTANYFVGIKNDLLRINQVPLNAALEFGIQQRSFYVSYQLTVPLTSKVWQRNRKWHAAYQKYESMYYKGDGIERLLYPQRFKSNDSSDGGGSDGGGSSSGGSCGGGNS